MPRESGSSSILLKVKKMKEFVKFFWEQTQQMWQMDAASKLQGKKTHYWIEATKWTDAYLQTLSKNKQDDFNKEWQKLDAERDLAQHLSEGTKEAFAKKLMAKDLNDDPEFVLNRRTLGYIKN